MNPQPILLWKHQKLTQAWTLRLGDKRYIGLVRTDKNGQSYWKFREFAIKPLNSDGNDSNSSPLDNIAKFQARQAKTEQIRQPHHEPAINQPAP